jgi:hypothetical protein
MQAGGSGASDEFVGGDLALTGKIPVAIRSLERQKKMPKQRFAEVKLSGNLADGNSCLVDRENSAGAIEI